MRRTLTTSWSPWVGAGLAPAITLAIIVSVVLLAGIGVLAVRDFFERERA